MAKDVRIQKSVRGESLPNFISSLKGVQAVVRDRAFELRAEAAAQLRLHEAEGKSMIPPARRVNQYAWRVAIYDPVDLTANGIDRGSAALYIEKGRRPYVVRSTWRTSRGRIRVAGTTYGGMEGLEIIAKAIAAVAARHRMEFR